MGSTHATPPPRRRQPVEEGDGERGGVGVDNKSTPLQQIRHSDHDGFRSKPSIFKLLHQTESIKEHFVELFGKLEDRHHSANIKLYHVQMLHTGLFFSVIPDVYINSFEQMLTYRKNRDLSLIVHDDSDDPLLGAVLACLLVLKISLGSPLEDAAGSVTVGAFKKVVMGWMLLHYEDANMIGSRPLIGIYYNQLRRKQRDCVLNHGVVIEHFVTSCKAMGQTGREGSSEWFVIGVLAAVANIWMVNVTLFDSTARSVPLQITCGGVDCRHFNGNLLLSLDSNQGTACGGVNSDDIKL